VEIIPKNVPIIFWGNEAEYNFVMDVPAPTRYLYLYPFMLPGYANDDMQNEFLDAIRKNKPAIVDIRPSGIPPVKSRAKWMQYPDMLPVVKYINDHYDIAKEINVNSRIFVDNQWWHVEQTWVVWIHK